MWLFGFIVAQKDEGWALGGRGLDRLSVVRETSPRHVDLIGIWFEPTKNTLRNIRRFFVRRAVTDIHKGLNS
jgi:hypothetical protein